MARFHAPLIPSSSICPKSGLLIILIALLWISSTLSICFTANMSSILNEISSVLYEEHHLSGAGSEVFVHIAQNVMDLFIYCYFHITWQELI